MKVSVVIPCYNEAKYISKCIESILSQKYNQKEIIVCDGGSNDGTIEILKQFTDKVKIIHNPQKTTPYALNLGIENSEGDIIIIFGAHATMQNDYIDLCVKTFEIDNKIMCVGGYINNINENNTSRNISTAMSSVFGVGNAHFRTATNDGYVDTVAFGAYKKEIFNIIGNFDIELIRNQDDEFNYRIIKHGYKIYLNPKIKSNYYVRSSYLKLFKQYYQYGYWKVYVNKKHKTITTIRQIFPLFFTLYLLSIIPVAILNLNIYLLYVIPLILYLMLSIVIAIIKNKKNRMLFYGVTFAFWILHSSYGLGYLTGILHFFIFRVKKINHTYTEITR